MHIISRSLTIQHFGSFQAYILVNYTQNLARIRLNYNFELYNPHIISAPIVFYGIESN